MKNRKKRRFIGLEFKLDGIPKNELQTLKIDTGIINGKFQAIIKTDSRTIPTNAVKGFRRESKAGFNLKKIYHKSSSGSLEPTSFLDDIDQLYAIDTNSKTIFGQNYSVGVVACLQVIEKPNGLCDVQIVTVDYLVHTDKVTKEESRNWKLFIEGFVSDSNNRSTKIGIVVDSDLGLIDQFNKKEIPIWDDFYLPDNITLLYASADIKNDTTINKLIAFCDEESTKSLYELETEMKKELTDVKESLIKKYPELVNEIKSHFKVIDN